MGPCPMSRDSGLGAGENCSESSLAPSPQSLVPAFSSRGHFFAAAAEAMRRILIEQVRRKNRAKHGGGQVRVDLLESDIASPMPAEELLALDEALQRFAAEEPLKARLVELRFFVGLTNEEAAELLEISSATAKRHWRYARAWLHQAVAGGDGFDSDS
jgi:RNA polymerase sigma factor (TIGR02999 family)